jgi:hypothetical protein
MVIQLPKPKNLSELRYHQLANSNAKVLGLTPPEASKIAVIQARERALESVRKRAEKLDW